MQQQDARYMLVELRECAETRNLKKGIAIHADAVQRGFAGSVYVATALINLYTKCGKIQQACGVFEGVKQPDAAAWNALIKGYADNGDSFSSLQLLARMRCQGCAPDSLSLLAALRASARIAAVNAGRQLHLLSHEIGCDTDAYVQCALIDMYAKCGRIGEARSVFEGIADPGVACWTALIMGYAEKGESVTALELLAGMRSQGCEPNSVTLVAALKAVQARSSCAHKEDVKALVRKLYQLACDGGCDENIHVQSTLIDVYAKCGSMDDARSVFNSVAAPNVVSWNVLISGYAENDDGLEALNLLSRMRSQGCAPSKLSLVSALKACSTLAANQDTVSECRSWRQRLRFLAYEGYDSDSYVQNSMIDMYSKAGCMRESQEIFRSVRDPNVVSWTALILGYAGNGEGVAALEWFAKMRASGCACNEVTFIAVAKACALLPNYREEAMRVHSLAIEAACDADGYLQSTLIDMYASCGLVEQAERLVNEMVNPNVVCWNALITGHAANGEGCTALNTFARMRSHGCAPNAFTFVSLAKACLPPNESLAKQVRFLAAASGYDADAYVQNAFIDMFARCGNLNAALDVFNSMRNPTVVSWTSLISGFSESGDAVKALDLFMRMQSHGCAPDSITFLAALKACCVLGALDSGRRIHREMIQSLDDDAFLVTCLIDLYTKCASMEEAESVFAAHPRVREPASWNALLSGYARLGDAEAAFGTLEGMQESSLQPDGVTFACILTCCSHAGLLKEGKVCFDAAMRSRHASLEHCSIMVDILGRSNKLDDAMALLRSMPYDPTSVVWMTVLGACRKWGNLGLGRLSFSSLLCLDEANVAAYVLMAHVYANAGLWEERAMVLGMREELMMKWSCCAKAGQSWWTDSTGNAHVFLANKM